MKKALINYESLKKTGLWYIERYAASTQSLRRVLRRKVAKAGHQDALDASQIDDWINSIVNRFTEIGLLNDYLVAQNFCESLIRQGNSISRMRLKLSQKGFENTTINQVVETIEHENENVDIKAALNLARRKRLGPYRTGAREVRREHRQQDLKIMGRAGFSYSISQQVIDGMSPENEE